MQGAAIRAHARGTVELVRDPLPVLCCTLVNGKALRSAGVELQPHIRDVIGLSCNQMEELSLRSASTR